MNPLKSLAAAFGYRLVRRREIENTLEEHLATLLPELGVNCVVDVGANEGQFGRILRGIGYCHRIVSLEPVPSVYALLAEGASGDRDWTTHQLALGSAPGRMPIHVSPSTPFASFREPSAYGRSQFPTRIEAERVQEVEVSTLDAMWPRFVEGIASPVVFVKLDTQGYDMEVLKGGARSIPRIAGVQCELAVKHIYEGVPGYLEVLRALAGMGFELTGLYPITREDKTLSIIEMDCVMRRP